MLFSEKLASQSLQWTWELVATLNIQFENSAEVSKPLLKYVCLLFEILLNVIRMIKKQKVKTSKSIQLFNFSGQEQRNVKTVQSNNFTAFAANSKTYLSQAIKFKTFDW